ncbi:GNAT family N-acetyltransferase [Brevundimonas vesicularis]|uniref:GNAT family N-acetyltransferase n=1 Tax=Brevundimonas vesicularis TaxID=41276 RepID=UPI0038D3F6C0
MALFDWMAEANGPVLHGQGLLLRPPRPADYAEWAELRELSRDYLQPWEPAWSEDDLTRSAFRRRLSIYSREMELGTAWPLFVYQLEGERLMGAITLSNIRRGVAETATMGYWIGQPFAGQGVGTTGVRLVLDFAFSTLQLHRVEAACVPTNKASRRVLQKVGFREEGLARAYLKINGSWADHLLFGILSDEYISTSPAFLSSKREAH